MKIKTLLITAIGAFAVANVSAGDKGVVEVMEESGSASWMTSLGEHSAENVGDTPVQIILVEVKSAATTSLEDS